MSQLSIINRVIQATILLISCWTVLFFLGPFRMEGGPIRTYYYWAGTPFDQVPIVGAIAAPIRLIICLATLAILGIRYRKGPTKNLYADLFWLSCAGLFLLWIVSSSLREAPWPVCLSVLFCGYKFLSSKQKTFLTDFMLMLLVLQLLICAWAYLTDYRQFHSPGIGERASGLLENPNSIYPVAMLAFFIFIGLSSQDPVGKLSLFYRGLAVLALLVLVATFSRAGWLGLAAGTAYLAWSRRSWISPFLCITFSFLMGAFVVRGMPIPSSFGDRSAQGHLLSMEQGIRVLPGLLIAGGGPHAFALSNGYQTMLLRSPMAAWEPKSLPLHIALEYGLPGLLIALVGLGALWKVQSASPIRALLIAVSIAGLFDTPIFANLTTMPATVLLVLALQEDKQRKHLSHVELFGKP